MAGTSLKGITIEIGGDASKLNTELKSVNQQISTTQADLKKVEKLLKLDPTNVTLLAQKQKLLNDAVKETSEKLDKLKQAAATANEQLAQGKITQEQYDALTREIIGTEQELNRLRTAAASSNVALSEISATADKVASSTQSVADATSGLSTAATAALTALAGLGYSTITYADDLNTLSKQTGFTTAELQELSYAADLIDVSLDSVTSAATKLKKNLSSDSDSVVSAFEELGVATTNADGSMRDSTDVFWDVITALGNVQNETERDALAMTLLGKGADELAGLIDDSAASFRQLASDAESAGLIMSQDTLDDMNAFNDALDECKAKLQATFYKTGVKVMETLGPVLESVCAALEAVMTAVASIDAETWKTIISVLAVVAAISPIFGTIAKIATGVSALTKAVTAIQALVIANPTVLVIAAIVAAVAVLTAVIIANWDKILAASEALCDAAADAWDGFCTSVKDGWDAVMDALKAALQTLKDLFASFGTAATQVFSMLVSAGKTVASFFSQLGTTIYDALTGAFTSAYNTIVGVFNSILSWCSNVASAIASVLGASSGVSSVSTGRSTVRRYATGGSMYSGTALVGEEGPELLTVSGGKATVTPLTATLDSKSVSALSGNGQPTTVTINFEGSLSQLAAVLQPAIKVESNRRGAAFAGV